MYLHIQHPCSNSADLNRHEESEAKKDFAHDVALAEQKLKGVDPVAAYKADILASKADLQDLLVDLVESGQLISIAYMALQERSDPANGEALGLFTDILDRLAQVAAETLSEGRGGLYDPTWMNADMEYQDCLFNLIAYKKELSR